MPIVFAAETDTLDSKVCADPAIAILPVAATEAHGPHLPNSTDCDIAEGHLNALAGHLSSSITALVLPVQRIGASREHLWAGNTESAEEADLMARWYRLIADLAQKGTRRVVIVSSHGGNSAVVDSLILKARAELDILAVGTAWMRFGYPDGLFSDSEHRYGIHGGDIETSLMLHYAPEKVDMGKAENFVSALEGLDARMTHLSGYGKHRFVWLSADFNPAGVVGDAGAATGEKGAALAEHILGGFARLLDDVARFDLDFLARGEAR